MNASAADFLLVRAGGRRVGLRLEDIVEVADLGEVFPLPSGAPAIRGMTSARGRLVPLLHLGAFLNATTCPEARSATIVLANLGGLQVCLEVDEADVVTRERLLPVPEGEALPWALAMAPRADGLVPILNLKALRERLIEAGSAT